MLRKSVTLLMNPDWKGLHACILQIVEHRIRFGRTRIYRITTTVCAADASVLSVRIK